MVNIDNNIFKNTLQDAMDVTPKEWSFEIEQFARETNIFVGLTASIIPYNRIGVPGNSLTVTKNAVLTSTALTDGIATPIQAISNSQVEVTSQEHGGAVQFTKKQLRDQLPTIRADTVSLLGEAIANEQEAVIIAELNTTGTTEVKVADTLTASSTFDLDTFNRALTSARIANRPARYFVVHPKVHGDMRALPDFRDASITGSGSTVATGFVGTYFGVPVIETTNITTEPVDGITAYNNLLLGDRALALLNKNSVSLEIDMGLSIDRAVTFHAVVDYGVQLLNEESVTQVQSA